MELIKHILNFFLGKEHSYTSKFIGLLSFFLILFIVDNLLGFSFYYSNNQKLNQIKVIRMLKKDCVDNEDVLIILNNTEEKILNRKNIIEIFSDLFTREPFESETISKVDLAELKRKLSIEESIISSAEKNICCFDSLTTTPRESIDILTIHDTASFIYQESQLEAIKDTTYEGTVEKEKTIDKPNKTRSKLWHTLSSSYFLVIMMIIIPFVPFTEKQMSWSTFAGAIIFVVFIAGLLWFNQYLLGLIPLILGKPWINYILNFSIHTLMLSLIGVVANKKNG